MRLEGIVLHGALDWRRSVSSCGVEPSRNDGPIEIGWLVGGLANRQSPVKKIPSPRGTPRPAIKSYQPVQYFRESAWFCREHRPTICTQRKGRAAEISVAPRCARRIRRPKKDPGRRIRRVGIKPILPMRDGVMWRRV